MKRDWSDFKVRHGGISGARDAFENACETMFRKKYSSEHVAQVLVKKGDGGIDIFIGELGVEPITVIQCKFFLESFEDSQKSQIRESYKTAITSKKYEMKNWILCLPRAIDIDENSWWFKWKKKKQDELSKDASFITLMDGNELIDLAKSLDLYDQIFDITDSNRLKDIHEAVVPKKKNVPLGVSPKTVLFNNYTKDKEPYYVERCVDNEFNESLKIDHVWFFGNSGVGKTALINRNLLQCNIEYCFCDMSPITIKTVDDVLGQIVYILEETFGIEQDGKESNLLKQIANLLCKQTSKTIVIVIDELSVEDDNLLKEIADSFIRLVAHYENKLDDSDLKFVVSTIADPNAIIQNKIKASSFFQYICCSSWDSYIPELFDVLTIALELELSESKEEIIQASNGSPRILKAIIKKIVICRNSNDESVKKAIKQSLEEVVG